MTTLYLDALEIDRMGSMDQLSKWLHTMITGKYDVNYLGDVQIWQFDFARKSDAMAFKLAWGAK